MGGSDAAASLVDSNGQDMIVVIQSDDFDQSQGLIVVDPSQLQHMVTTTGAGGHLTGTTTTTTSNGEGEEMIVSDAHHGQGHNEYISLQMPDGDFGLSSRWQRESRPRRLYCCNGRGRKKDL